MGISKANSTRQNEEDVILPAQRNLQEIEYETNLRRVSVIFDDIFTKILIEKYDLSKAEILVCFRLAQGVSGVEIAKEMFVTESTIKFHVTNIKEKMKIDKKYRDTGARLARLRSEIVLEHLIKNQMIDMNKVNNYEFSR